MLRRAPNSTDIIGSRFQAETRSRRRCRLLICAVCIAATGAALFPKTTPWLVWNASPSAPIGWYWVKAPRSLSIGDMVLALPPEWAGRLAAERGYLPAGVPLVKRVAAVPGDRVCAIGAKIRIDGRVVSPRLSADRKGRPMPGWTGCRGLGRDVVFLLMEKVPDSFDGRYFGPTDRKDIVGRLVPLWTR
jgi:conjugative transfer signal peptidase TraF